MTLSEAFREEGCSDISVYISRERRIVSSSWERMDSILGQYGERTVLSLWTDPVNCKTYIVTK